MSSSKLSALCDKTIEAGWLAAAVVTPLFFNVYSRRAFEADKLLLLRSIVIIMVVAWLVKWIEQCSVSRSSPPLHLRGALVLPTLILAAVYLLTTVTSITPRISFFGSYTRLQGTYTTLSYIVIFFLIAQGLRTRRQLDRLILTTILVSLPVALYGLIQNYDLDPLRAKSGETDRVFANMGNPIYLAAYLSMAFFLTLGKSVEFLGRVRRNANGMAINLLGTVSCVCVAAAQIAAIVFAGSRGPFLGWLAGLALFALLLALLLHWRAVALGLVGLGLAGVVFLLVANLPGSPLAGQRHIPTIGRLTDLAVNSGDSAHVRLLIWEGSADLVQAHQPIRFPDGTPDPLNVIRPLVGYGPESMYLVFSQYFPTALVSQTGYSGDTLVGRSHNETWDTLINSGVIGGLAYQFLFLSFFLYGLQSIGLVTTRRERNGFIGLWMGLGLMGGLTTILVGKPQYLGLGIPGGTLIATGSYLVLCAIRSDRHPQRTALSRADQVLLAALLAGVLAHYVEIQFSFGVASTRLLFWVFAGTLAAVGSKQLVVEDASPETTFQPNPWISSMASHAAIAGMILSTLFYEFVTNNVGLTAPLGILWSTLTSNGLNGQTTYAVPGMLLLTWAFALLIVFTDMAHTGVLRSFRNGLAGLILFAALSMGVTVAFGLGRATQLSALAYPMLAQVQDVVALADRRVGLFDYYALSLFLLILLTALTLMAEYKLPTAWSANRWSWVVLAPFALIGYLWINAINLNPVRADMIYSFGQLHSLSFTIVLDQRAINQAPYEDVYYRGLGYALMSKADLARETSVAQFDDQTPLEKVRSLNTQQMEALGPADLLYAARAVFVRARQINPLNADHTAGLALLDSRLAGLTTDPAQRSRLAHQASQQYAQATTLRPRDVNLWNEWAMLDLIYQDDPDSALRKLETSRKINPRHAPTYLYLGQAFTVRQNPGQAIQAYLKYIELAPGHPNAWNTHKALALLYAQTSDFPSAVREAQIAAGLAPSDIAPQLNELAAQWRTQMATPQPSAP